MKRLFQRLSAATDKPLGFAFTFAVALTAIALPWEFRDRLGEEIAGALTGSMAFLTVFCVVIHWCERRGK